MRENKIEKFLRKTRKISCMVILNMVFICLSGAGAETGTVIFASGFEDDAKPYGGCFIYDLEKVYGNRKNDGLDAFFGIDEKNAYSGKRSFTIIGKKNCNHGDIGREIRFLPDTTYRYSAWFKFENTELAKFQALWYSYNRQDKQAETRVLKTVETSLQDWTYYETTFRTSPDLGEPNSSGINGCIRPIRNFSGIGQVWVDDVILEIVEKDGRDTVVDNLQPPAATGKKAQTDDRKNKNESFTAEIYPPNFSSFKDSLRMIRGVPVELAVYFRWSTEKPENPVISFDIPFGVSPDLSFKSPVVRKAVKKELDGGRFNYKVYLNPDILRSTKTFMLTMQASPDFNLSGFDLNWHLEDNDKILSAETVKCEIISFAPEKINSKFMFISFPSVYSYRFKGKDISYLEKLLNVLREYGINQGYDGAEGYEGIPGLLELQEKAGLKSGWSIMLDNWSGANRRHFPDLTTEDKLARDINLHPVSRSDKAKTICPMLRIAKDESYDRGFLEYCRKTALNSKFDMFCWDFEPELHCYCTRCVKAFSEFVKKPEIQKLSPAEIVNKYPKEWLQFEVWRSGQIMKVWAETMKEAKADCTILACGQSLELNETDLLRHQKITPQDARNYDQHVDIHLPMIYSNPLSTYNKIERMVKELKKPVIPAIGLWWSDSPPNATLCIAPEDLELCIFSAITAGCKGVCFFPGCSLYSDALYLKNMNECLVKVAYLEDYFIKGTLVNQVLIEPKPLYTFTSRAGTEAMETWFPDWQTLFKSRAHLLRKNTESSFLIDLFNFSTAEGCYVSIIFPELNNDGKYSLYDPFQKTVILPADGKDFWDNGSLRKGLMYYVPERSVKFLVLEEFSPRLNFEKKIRESDLMKQYENYLKRGKMASGKTVSIIKGQGELLLETPVQTVVVNCKIGGRIWDWQIKNKVDLVNPAANLKYGGYGGLCFDLFINDGAVSWGEEEDAEYKEISSEVTGDGILICLERKLSSSAMKGITVRKTYLVLDKTPRIECRYSIENDGISSREITFFSHNTINMASEKDFLFLLPEKNGVIEKKNIKENEFYYTPESFAALDKKEEKNNHIVESDWIALYDPSARDTVKIKFEKNKLEKIWLQGNISPMPFSCNYKSVLLEPGRKWETCLSFTYAQEMFPNKNSNRNP